MFLDTTVLVQGGGGCHVPGHYSISPGGGGCHVPGHIVTRYTSTYTDLPN